MSTASAALWLQELPLERNIKADSVPLQLLELALWFLIYTEAANLRHTPHLLFLIFYIMRSSKPFLMVGEWWGDLPVSRCEGPKGHWIKC
jgi:hypothetical protein